MLRQEELLQELESVRLADSDRKLRPEAVLEAARPLTSRLHGYFEWDDGEAAEKYRMEQARRLIRVAVTVIPRTNEQIRAYVSLTSDRVLPDEYGQTGGYRATAEVMSDGELQRIMLDDAMAELRRFELKYSRLHALAPVFDAIREAREQQERQSRGGRRRTSRSREGAGQQGR